MGYRLPPLSTLRVFEAAARHLSFKSAADELHLTPSAVSRSIQVLEAWLGIPLFTRNHRSIALTTAGSAYADEVRTALDLLAHATESVPGRGPRGSLVISAAPTFGLRWLMPRLGRFKAIHPEIAITMDTSHRQVDFAREGVDLAIRMGKGSWPNLDAQHLVTESLVPVCAPSLASRITSLEDLADVPRLLVTNVSADWDHWAAAAGHGALDKTNCLRFDSIEYALRAAAKGLGIAMGRRPLVDDDLASGELVAVLGGPVPSTSAYWLICPPPALARPEVRAFHTWIKGELAATPRPELAPS